MVEVLQCGYILDYLKEDAIKDLIMVCKSTIIALKGLLLTTRKQDKVNKKTTIVQKWEFLLACLENSLS